MMRVLAFDPGVHIGWGLVETRTPFQALASYYQAGGELPGREPTDLLAVDAMLGDTASGTLVAVEWLEGVAYDAEEKGQSAVAALLAASAVAGAIEAFAMARGFETIRMPARMWRNIVVGRASATDAQIKIAVTRMVRDLPVRTNAHLRDAVGLALAVSWKNWRRPA